MKLMHKHIISKAVIFIFLATAVASCKKDFLEITPKGKLIAQKVSDYDLLLNNLDLINVGALAQAPMGDEIAAIEPYFSGSNLETQRLYRWDAVIYEPAEDAYETKGPLESIYIYNKIINEIPNATGGTDQQKKSIAAEAMAGRAWTYFLLINYFGKPYNESTAATDLGFPIVTEANVSETKFTRASVKEVYDFIIKDLTTALPDLPVQTTHRLRMSKAAAEGILGKVYMFMGKFTEALPYLSAALTDIHHATIPIHLYDYNVTLADGGIFTPVGSYGPEYPTTQNNEENVYGRQSFNSWTSYNNEIVINPQTVALYKPSDLRLQFYSHNAFFGPAYPSGMLRKMGPSSTQYGVVVPDLYLLSAECKARLDDLTGAVSDVETLRKNRMPAADASVPAAIASQKLPLLQFILQERVREFAVEGYRWFDMRRLSVDPLFTGAAYQHNVYDENGAITDTYTLKPERFVLKFPQKILNQNPGMQDNP